MEGWKTEGEVALRPQNGYSNLCCPRCRSSFLHHVGLVNYGRQREDASVMVKTTLIGNETEVDVERADGLGNPSRRRDAAGIFFWCEQCSDPDLRSSWLELTFAQHKGETQVAWRFDPDYGPAT